MRQLTEKEIDTFEKCGWAVGEDEGYFYISNYSPKGEDLCEDFDYDRPIIDQIQEKVDMFDPEEHAAMWYNAEDRGQPKSLRILLADADAIHEMLKQLLQKFKEV